MPTLKTCQVTHELYFRHVDPKSIVKSHRENLLSLHGMEEAGLPLIRSIGYVLNAVHQPVIVLDGWRLHPIMDSLSRDCISFIKSARANCSLSQKPNSLIGLSFLPLH